jgi:uncharacterized membrane protein
MTRRDQVRKFLRDNFFSGLLVVVPTVVSIYVVIQLLRWLYRKLIFLTFPKTLLSNWLAPRVPGWAIDEAIKLIQTAEFIVVLAALVILTALIGLITKIGLIRWLFRIAETVLERIPLVGMVYSALKQLLQAVFSGKGNFSKVVMIQFPRPGLWSMGFITRASDPAFEDVAGKGQLYNIFIPTTPNVTTGFLVVAPKEEFLELDISIEQAFKFIISGGMVLPHEEPEKEKDDSLIGRIKDSAGRKVRGFGPGVVIQEKGRTRKGDEDGGADRN